MKTLLPFLLLSLFLWPGLHGQDLTPENFRSYAKQLAGHSEGIQKIKLKNPVCQYRAEDITHKKHVAPPASFQPEALDFRSEGSDCSEIVVTYRGFGEYPEAILAFEYAVDIWESMISSPVPILIEADFTELGPGILGSAGPNYLYVNFSADAEFFTWYPDALANTLAGYDLDPANPEIYARFSSTFNWYFGLDGNPPPGTYDFVTVVLHEIGHGLGFFGLAEVDPDSETGIYGWGNYPLIYDYFVQDGQGFSPFDNEEPGYYSELLWDYFQSEDLYSNAPKAVQANGGNLPPLYAPSDFLPGSSYSHWDEAAFPPGDPQSLMTPFLGFQEAIHDPGAITLGMFEAHGWTPAQDCEPADPGNITIDKPCEIEAIVMDPLAPEPICDWQGVVGPPGTHAIFVRVDPIHPLNAPPDLDAYRALVDGVEYPIFTAGFDYYSEEVYLYIGIGGIPSEGQEGLDVEILLKGDCSGIGTDLYDAPDCTPPPCNITKMTLDPRSSGPQCDRTGNFGPPGTHFIHVAVYGITYESLPPDEQGYHALVDGVEYPIFTMFFDRRNGEDFLDVGIAGIPGDGKTGLSVEIILAENCSAIADEVYDAPFCAPTFQLIDAQHDVVLGPLEENQVLQQTDLPRKVSFMADPNSFVDEGDYDRIELRLDGPVSYTHWERTSPYTLFSNRGNDYKGRFLPQGAYRLTASAYLGDAFVRSIDVLFSVEGPKPGLGPFVLVDAIADIDLMPLHDGDRLNGSILPARVNVRTEPDSDPVGSVVFELEGPVSHFRTENTAPFSLFGNNHEDYFGEQLAPGFYILTATPYSGRNAFGQAGVPLAISFEVFSGQLTLRGEGGLKAPPTWQAYPNPASGPITVQLPERQVGGKLFIRITDIYGRQLASEQIVDADQQTLTFDRKALGIPPGTYLLHARNDNHTLKSLRIVWHR